MKTFAVIPTLWKTPHIYNLIETLQNDIDIDRIIFMHNGGDSTGIFRHDEEKMLKKVEFIMAVGKSIYEMWNLGWNKCLTGYSNSEPFNVLFLNDDIDLTPNSGYVLKKALRGDDSLAAAYPDINATYVSWSNKDYFVEYSTGTSAHNNGLVGYCFMVKGELDFRFDENLKLYWGDDDFAKQVTQAGYKIGRVVGLPISHAGSFTVNQMDREKRRTLMEADRAYFNAKYGESREPVA